MRTLARWLAGVHAERPPDRGPEPGDLVSPLEDRARRLAERLLDAARSALVEVAAAQRDFLAQHGERLRARQRAGRVRAFDLPPPRLAELRVDAAGRTVREPGTTGASGAARDVCADGAGLALELASGGRGDLAERLLSAYAGLAHDFDLYTVVDFHERDRALELAESALGGSGTGAEAARRLLLAALSTRRRPLLPPVVVAVGGQVARGKSTVSRALAERLGAPRVEADRVRDAMLGEAPAGVGGERRVHEVDWERAFAPDFGEQVYAELLRCAAAVLGSGRPVVLDACFPSGAQRVGARSLARRFGRAFLFVECRADDGVVEARLAARDASGGSAWRELARRLAERWEPVDALAPGEHCVLRTDGRLDDALGALEVRLPAWPEGLAE